MKFLGLLAIGLTGCQSRQIETVKIGMAPAEVLAIMGNPGYRGATVMENVKKEDWFWGPRYPFDSRCYVAFQNGKVNYIKVDQ